jgi:hypothetical protein
LLRGLVRERAKLAEELAPTFVDQRRELSVVISKNMKRAEAANSWPMNSIGVCGPSSVSAISARLAARRGLCMHAIARNVLPTWSWFCRKVISAHGGTP